MKLSSTAPSEVGSLQAVLLDMDGTVCDSEPHWLSAEQAYASRFGVDWTSEDAHALVGRSAEHTTAALIGKTGSGHTHQQVFAFLLERLVEAIATGAAGLRPGIEDLISELKVARIPLALVTSSEQAMADALAARLPAGTFDAVVSASDVANLKPHPEPYLMAMSALGVRPEGCVVIEDSASGMTSGIKAGAKVIGIPSVVAIPPMPGTSRMSSAEELNLAVLRRVAAGEIVNTLDTET